MKQFIFNSPEVIKRKIRSVAVQLSPSFDGGILATIMNMIYYQGVKIEEFQIMKIGYVVAGGKILKRFDSIYPPYPSLHNDYKILIQCHLDYLEENNYSLKMASPLFPKITSDGKKEESSAYQDFKIAKHLKEHAGITGEQLWRDGVYHHYLLLVWQGYSNQDIINLTAWYFREKKEKIYTILKQGGIKLLGVKKELAVKAQPTIPPTMEQKAKKRIGRKIPTSSRQDQAEMAGGSTGSQTHTEPLTGEDGKNQKLGSIGQKIDFRKIGNKDPFKDFDDGDTEDAYWDDDED